MPGLDEVLLLVYGLHWPQDDTPGVQSGRVPAYVNEVQVPQCRIVMVTIGSVAAVAAHGVCHRSSQSVP
jgi:hypothetical protein